MRLASFVKLALHKLFKEGFLKIGPSEYLKIYAVSITLAWSIFNAVNKRIIIKRKLNNKTEIKRTAKSYCTETERKTKFNELIMQSKRLKYTYRNISLLTLQVITQTVSH